MRSAKMLAFSRVASLVPPSIKVLIVEDEPGLRQMLEILFRREGYSVVSAPGCRSALEAISQNPQPFPVVLTDLAMPDGSGMEVLAAAKARNPATEVILITAHSTVENAIGAMRSGAYDFVAKPFDAAELADIDVHPDVRLAVAREATAATEADLARAAKKPDWSAELTYAVRGAPYSNMVSLMVSIDLPWSPGTRQDREHAAKLKELDAARAMREDTRRMRVAEVDTMLTEWETARAMARRIEEELIPLATQRLDAVLASYRGGTGALSPVLEARRSELDARLALLQQEQAVAKAWAWLQFVRPMKEGS